jgi:hypothetical protein
VSASQLRATITATDLATARSVPVTVVTPAPGGGTSGSATFTVAAPPAPIALPTEPGSVTVTRRGADASGVTFTVAWTAGNGATSYRYIAAYNDGSASQQGTISGLLSFPLTMPYHASGAAFDGFVCLSSVNAAGQSADQACNALPVPARP